MSSDEILDKFHIFTWEFKLCNDEYTVFWKINCAVRSVISWTNAVDESDR